MEFIKTEDNNKYIIEKGVKYLIPDLITQNALGYKDEIFSAKDDKYLNQIKSGPEIENIKTVELVWPINNLVPVYAIFHYPSLFKRHVPNPVTLFAIGRNFNEIKTLSVKEFNKIPDGGDLTFYESWDENAQKLGRLNFPPTPELSARINVFGPNIDPRDLNKFLDYRPKNIHNIHYQIDVQAGLLGSFFGLQTSCLTLDILLRYIEVSGNDLLIVVIPHTDIFADRLVEPLVSAKRQYCFGEFLATIALCGKVGEMLALLVWKMNEVKINENLLNKTTEEDLFGKSFEELEQYRRIKILHAYNLITQSQCDTFNRLRGVRKPYLHRWEYKIPYNPRFDALKSYKDAFILFRSITDINFSQGISTMNQKLLKFLQSIK